MLIILGFLAGASFLYLLVTRPGRQIEPGQAGETFAMLREELDSLTVRLGRVEEEMDFYRQLKAPGEPEVGRRLDPPKKLDP